MLIAIVVLSWLLWLVACVIALAADILQKKRPADAGFSILPVIPLFPMLFIGAAWLIDIYAASWGTRLIGGLHALLILAYAAAILYDLRRIRAARRPRA